MKVNNFLTTNPYLVLFVSALMVVFSVTYFALAQGTVTTIGEYIEIKEPTADNHAATKAYVDASIPPGSLDWSQAYVVEDRVFNVPNGYYSLEISCNSNEVLRDRETIQGRYRSGLDYGGGVTSYENKYAAQTVNSYKQEFWIVGEHGASTAIISGICVPFVD